MQTRADVLHDQRAYKEAFHVMARMSSVRPIFLICSTSLRTSLRPGWCMCRLCLQPWKKRGFIALNLLLVAVCCGEQG